MMELVTMARTNRGSHHSDRNPNPDADGDDAPTTDSLQVENPPHSADTIAQTGTLIGCDTDDRRHYIREPTPYIYVLAPSGNDYAYVYDLSDRSLADWYQYVDAKCGWAHSWPVPERERLASEPPEIPRGPSLKRKLLGIDEDGYRHYLDRVQGVLFVLTPSVNEVEAAYDISTGCVQTWVTQVKHATGWSDLRYSDAEPIGWLAEQIAELAAGGDERPAVGESEDGSRAE